uniref:DDE Tnp4 domain-containing protein n=1 Tax=Hippocampus comes TaxID=109280 RepID=A0A3Q3DET4_HIPCM
FLFFFFVLLMRERKERLLKYRRKTIWMKTRSSVWWDRVVNGSFTHSNWTSNCRMSKEAFGYVCEKLRPSLSHITTAMRMPISVEKWVTITLWKLATNTCYRTIGHFFGVTCSAIVSEMSQDLIKWPRWGFPQVLGAIDGTHIPIIRPHDCHTDYYNRKGFYSVIMQAVVDSSYRFIDIFIVFTNSPLYQNRTSVPVPLVLLGDAAYPLSTRLMKPFSDNGRLTQPQKEFNYKHSRARMVVENAFGRLKGGWRILLKTQDTHLVNFKNIVAACCTLHNLCEKWGEHFDNEWMVASCENDETTDETRDDQRPTCDSAAAIRQALLGQGQGHFLFCQICFMYDMQHR